MAPLARQQDFYVPEAETRQEKKKLPGEEESYSDTDVSGICIS